MTLSRAKVLVADDEPNLRRVLAAILTRDGHDVIQVADGGAAIARLHDVDVVITDLRMPTVSGMEVLKKASAHHPNVPVIMITAFGSVDNAVAAVKSGAFDYIEKPFEQEQIRQIVQKAVKQSLANRKDLRTLTSPPEKGIPGRFGLIGGSSNMLAIFDVISRVADTPSTVLITGESGTGKELVAKALHENSSRKDGPFIKINCAAIPKNLMESELFGYDKGAFTGAVNAKPGRFELADGGTLFLDEIGEIPIEMQVKLLRALQESEFERVGGIKTIKVNVRLVTATNRDLEREVKEGNFRDDLFYRLNVVPIMIPPLRERPDDIPYLVSHILVKFNERLKKNVQGVQPDAMKMLQAYAWPGNIRELENLLERTLLFCSGNEIEPGDLRLENSAETKALEAKAAEAKLAESTAQMKALDANVNDEDEEDDEFARSPELSTPFDATSEAGNTSLKDAVRAETSRIEKELISKALDETNGNVTQAAKLLKISRKSLQTKMKEFGLRDRENP